MVNSQVGGNGSSKADVSDPLQVAATFQKAVIDRFQISITNRLYTYQEYLGLPAAERRNDEADG
jgi:hypothetical protein